MLHTKPWYRDLGVLAFVLWLSAVAANAQVTPPLTEYTVKFLCGTNPAAGGLPVVAPGTYKTSINIHNPALPLAGVAPTAFSKKAVLALQEGLPPIPPSALKQDVLAPDFAEEVDCGVIRALLGPAGAAPFIEGWVVIYVPQPPPPAAKLELDVEGVYTNALGAIQIVAAKEHDF